MFTSSMDRRKFLKASGGVTGVGLFAGCVGEIGGGGGGDSGPITIGAIEPLSGNFTPWGKAHRDGLRFAVKELNDDGGVLDRELDLKIQDTESNPGSADSAFREFVEQDNAVAVTGPVSSDVGIRTSRTAQELEVPLFLHMSGSDKAITPETRHTFRVGLLPAATTMKAQAQLVSDRGYEKVAAIVGDYAWGQSVKSAIENEFPVDVNIQVAPVSASDFKSQIRKFDKDTEMVIASGHPPGQITITKQLFQLGYEPETLTGSGFPTNVLFGALGSDITRGVTHIHNSDIYSEEYAKVGQRYADEEGKYFDTHTAYGYVTAKLIAAAVEDAGEANASAIADATRNIQFDTLFANPIQYSEHGELKDQIQLYSQFEEKAPSFYPDGKYTLTELFRTDPLPALPAEE